MGGGTSAHARRPRALAATRRPPSLQVSARFGIDLWRAVLAEPRKFANDALLTCIARQAVALLARLHADGLMHRDLKLPNMLIS